MLALAARYLWDALNTIDPPSLLVDLARSRDACAKHDAQNALPAP
jgi:hypothetical protein